MHGRKLHLTRSRVREILIGCANWLNCKLVTFHICPSLKFSDSDSTQLRSKLKNVAHQLLHLILCHLLNLTQIDLSNVLQLRTMSHAGTKRLVRPELKLLCIKFTTRLLKCHALERNGYRCITSPLVLVCSFRARRSGTF